MPMFLEIFKPSASKCGFHGKLLTRATPRNFEVIALSARVSLIFNRRRC